MKTHSVWLCIIAFLVLLSPTYAQETLEQRVERLDREVAELQARVGLVDSISIRPVPQELVGNGRRNHREGCALTGGST